jgi:transcriptional regulator with XRE-family HTH domain
VITKDKLTNELKNKQYRDAFVSAHVDIGIPHQIRILREQRGWTQQDLADRTAGKQAWIAKIENPNYTGFSLKTLKKLASAFDVAIIVRFVPISNLVKWELEISPESLQALSFELDPYFKETSHQQFQPPIFSYKGNPLSVLGGARNVVFSNPSESPKTNLRNLADYRTFIELQNETGSQKQKAIMGA